MDTIIELVEWVATHAGGIVDAINLVANFIGSIF